jgi:hypothetical protein
VCVCSRPLCVGCASRKIPAFSEIIQSPENRLESAERNKDLPT